MPISRESVVWGFRLILGRDPESEEGIRAHMHLDSETALAEALMRSQEFRASGRFADLLQSRQRGGPGQGPTWPHEQSSKLSMVVLGNCQAAGIGELLQAMTGGVVAQSHETTPNFLDQVRRGEFDLERTLASADLVFVQMVGEVTRLVTERYPRHAAKLRQLPPLSYSGFHPDCVYVAQSDGGYVRGPMGEYQSSLCFWAWRNGLSVEQAIDLFRDEVFDSLGFHDYHTAARKVLVANGTRCGLSLAPLIDQWMTKGCFMHTVNHPKLFALADVLDLALRREGIEPLPGAHDWVEDRLARWPVWPVYPPLAKRLGGVVGSYQFKLDRGLCPPGQPVLSMSLGDFVEQSYKIYRGTRSGQLQCERITRGAYDALPRFVREKAAPWRQVSERVGELLAPLRGALAAPTPSPSAAASPYEGLPDHQFWRRAVERIAPADLDPVVRAGFSLARSDRIATGGSCFAQHIARALQRDGFNYMVADADPSLPAAESQRRGFGMYSARYGNLYTARQLVQLFDRAHGDFEPLDRAWQRPDGRYVDPFRPQIEPDGFARPVDAIRATRRHLADVRRLFTELDVFVFTLGLTEGWRRREDGAVFPLAPGVAAGQFDPSLYEFVNFGVDDTQGDMQAFLTRLRRVNPVARMIVTVSPVPLIATYEDRHVLVSTVHSKSVLRVAAGNLASAMPGVDYFPSYEIITGAHSRGRYFEPDLRSVRPQGVAHVMRVFFRHYAQEPVAGGETPPGGGDVLLDEVEREAQQLGDIVCDEEALDRHHPKRPAQ